MIEVEAGTLRRARQRRRLGLVGVLVALLALGIGALALTRAIMYRNAVLPEVAVAGVDLGGLGRDEARAKVDRVLGARLEKPITVTVGRRHVTAVPSALFALDADATARRAFDEARSSLLDRLVAVTVPFGLERDVEPVLTVRTAGRDAFAKMLLALTRRPVSARVEMRGVDAVVVGGRFGASLDPAAVLARVRSAALAGGSRVDVKLTPERPAIVRAEAAQAAARADAVAAEPFQVYFRGRRVGGLSRTTLAKRIRFQPVDGGYNVVLAHQALGRVLGPMVAEAARDPVDASFEVVGTRVHVVPSRGGTQVAARKAARAILRVATIAGTRHRTVAIVLAKREADLTTKEAKALGIREQVSTFTTDMGPSSSNRIWNVQLLGQILDGTILKPGEKFSFNAVMGPRTPERGFREGQMIFGGVLVPAIGGGVCQTATTIFNAAFEAGLPVLERHNHSFYISHYPLGRDATVSWGGPDLVFRNDLKHAILIKASGTSATFTVSFYGTKQRRRVVASTSDPTNYTQPRLQYAIDPAAPRGSVRRTEAGGPGFDVNVHRKVYQRGKLLREDDFFTRYTPENPTQVYGPGSTPPGPYFTLPTS